VIGKYLGQLSAIADELCLTMFCHFAANHSDLQSAQ